jgi:hypothetical protein
MQSLQRDSSTKNTCEKLILVSGPTQEQVDPDLSDFVVLVPYNKPLYQEKEKDTSATQPNSLFGVGIAILVTAFLAFLTGLLQRLLKLLDLVG